MWSLVRYFLGKKKIKKWILNANALDFHIFQTRLVLKVNAFIFQKKEKNRTFRTSLSVIHGRSYVLWPPPIKIKNLHGLSIRGGRIFIKKLSYLPVRTRCEIYFFTLTQTLPPPESTSHRRRPQRGSCTYKPIYHAAGDDDDDDSSALNVFFFFFSSVMRV